MLGHRRLQHVQMSGADTRVDVQAIRGGADRDDLSAGPAQRRGAML